jgi:hypothetical protein
MPRKPVADSDEEEDIQDVRVAKNFVNMSLGELRQHEKGILKIVEDDLTVAKRNNRNTTANPDGLNRSTTSLSVGGNDTRLSTNEYN